MSEFVQPLTVRRATTPVGYVRGRPTSPVRVDIIVDAVVFPADPDAIVMLPEGEHGKQTLAIYTEAALQVADESTGLTSDLIVHEGRDFRVVASHRHSEGVLDHVESYAVRA